MKNRLGYEFVIILFFFGCQSKIQQVEHCDTLKIDLEQLKDFSVWDICSDIELVPLETSDSCLMSMVYPYTYHNLHFMRQNNPNLVNCFDSLGHFLYSINNQGRGEEEYAYINGIVGDPYSPGLYLPEDLNDINIYDLEGHFRQKIHLDSVRETIHQVMPLNRDTLIVVSGRYNLNFSFYSRRDNRIVAQTKDHLPAIATMPFFRIGEKVYYFTALDRIVYEVQDTSFIPVLSFDFGKYNPVHLADYADFNRKIVTDAEMESFLARFNYFVTAIWGSPEYLCIALRLFEKDEWKDRIVLINRETKKYVVFNRFKETLAFTPFNDLIGDQWIWTIGSVELEDNLEIDLLDKKNREIYRKIKPEDNPIVVKVRLKL